MIATVGPAPIRDYTVRDPMRFARYILIFLVIAVIAGTAASWVYRDNLAHKVANRALRGQNLSVVDVSIRSLDTESVAFAELVLEQDNGTRILLEGIELPVSLRSPRPTSIAIDSIVVEPVDDDRPQALSLMLLAFLDLPLAVANTDLSVGLLVIPGLPPVSDLEWQSGTTGQELSVSIDRFRFTMDIAERTDAGYHATIDSRLLDGTPASLLELQVLRQDDHLAITGTTRVSLESWLPTYHQLGIVPERLKHLAADLSGDISLILFDDPVQPALVTARLGAMDDISAIYGDTETPVEIRTRTIGPINTRFEYPSLDWSASVASAELAITTAKLQDVPVALTGLQCGAGILCTVQAEVATDTTTVDKWSFDSLQAGGFLTVRVGATTQIKLSSESRVAISKLKRPGTEIGSIDSTQWSNASMQIDDAGWRFTADAIPLQIGSLELDAGVNASLNIDLANLLVRNDMSDISAEYSTASLVPVNYENAAIVLPGAHGNFRLHGDAFTSTQILSTPDGGISGELTVDHDLATSTGRVLIQDLYMDFANRYASAYLAEWPYAWDVVGGIWSLSGGLDWDTSSEETRYSGILRHSLSGITGTDGESVFAGLESEFEMTMADEAGLATGPARLQLELLDVGVPVEDITVQFTLEPNTTIAVDALSMSLLGGKMSTDPFRLDPNADSEILLRPQSIQLEFIVGLLDFQKLAMEGSVSGRLPLRVTSERITIDGGRLESDAPGGSIQFGSGGSDLTGADAQIGLVSKALANFQFESLTSDVNYDETGDLVLNMRLEGVNPDMDANQPVILNLNVENNIPQMLKSLQATRSIEQILEKQFEN